MSALAVLPAFPEQGREISGGRRELMIPFSNSGYVAQYRVDAEHITVARIFHMRERRR